jgi:hypothetical protein
MARRLRFVSWGLLLGVLALGGCLQTPPAAVAGGWTGTLTWTGAPVPGMTMPLTLTLTQEDRTVDGEIGLMGPGSKPFSLAISAGSVEGDAVSIAASGTLETGSTPQQIAISLSGTCNGTRMTGTGTQTVEGSTYAFTWEATLTAPPPSEED